MDDLSRGFTPIIDVGAGPGLDAARVGALAVDLSWAMARRGHQRGVRYVVGDLRNLPLADSRACFLRRERVLARLEAQHTA